MTETRSAAARVEAALRVSPRALTVSELAKAALGSAGVRERSAVRIALYRLGERGLIEKTASTYRLKT